MILHMLLTFGVCILIYLGFIAENSKHSIKFFKTGASILNKSQQGAISRSKSLTEVAKEELIISESGI